jgi:MYXO-CTERM domain-containing protein
MLVPSRMALVLVRDGLAPQWIGIVSDRTGTPVLGLASTLAVSLALVLGGQVSLALNIAVFALVALYLLHSAALLLLPRWNPALFATVEAPIPIWVQRLAGVVSIVSMAGLLAIQLHADAAVLRSTTLRERAATHQLTTVELAAAWGLLGLVLYAVARRRQSGA